jgi:hypothetical protein
VSLIGIGLEGGIEDDFKQGGHWVLVLVAARLDEFGNDLLLVEFFEDRFVLFGHCF